MCIMVLEENKMTQSSLAGFDIHLNGFESSFGQKVLLSWQPPKEQERYSKNSVPPRLTEADEVCVEINRV